MLTPSDENIHEFVDGRLSAPEAAKFAAHVAANPHLRRRVAALWLINQMLRGLGQHILDEPVPERLAKIVRVRPSAPDGSSTA
ncbi:hypothetical protein AUC70_12335 [Methyloceanibacter stevinii]|uniref:Zinc-finger domain-containing protein n=1 Tax=Methyloceanibacter stevinii TaxID=1774970 RepID=A0A1E3VKZ2_9HYPH|nr:hypothetical protein AUC70_12335 [Methyloceanibacter stevinii]